MIRSSQIKEDAELLLDEDIALCGRLILYNDDVNTFYHVITCLIAICKHTPEQAEQCALLVHFKGKAIVKEGEDETLIPMCQALCDKGLSAVIE